MDKKFCPDCKGLDLKSRVYVGTVTRTLMAVTEYYDEDGKRCFSDPNKTTTSYSCSNGHAWREVV